MSKRQVLVESITECLIKRDRVELNIKLYDENLATVNLTSKNNPGGEAWDWAQGNWPEFVPEEKEFELIASDGSLVKVKAPVKWVCVTGVVDPKTRKSLPIEELRESHASNRRWGAAKRGQKVKPVKVKEPVPLQAQKTKSKNSPKGNSLAKTPNKLAPAEDVGEVDLQALIDERVQEVMGEEN